MKTCCNPIMDGRCADPSMLWYKGRYYLYGTSAVRGIPCYSSADLREWKKEGLCFEADDRFYGVDLYWAPEVYERDGRFILVFSCRRSNKLHAIACAVSDSPVGPFRALNDGQPIFAPDYSVIDGDLLFDDDGRIYLYYSKDCSTNFVDGRRESHSYVVELSPDLTHTVSEPVFLTAPDADWEKKSGDTRWNEGPCCFKRNGIYYLMYTANYFASAAYAVGYATSSAPTGPFVKAKNNPILSSDGVNVTGTGHNNYFFSPDGTEMWTVYHSLRNKVDNTDGRAPNIDRMLFDEDGTLRIAGPTVTEQPLPSGTEA